MKLTDSIDVPRPSNRHRVDGRGAALVTRVATLPRDAVFGTELTPPRRRRMSAFKGEAVMSLYLSLVLN
jgi:hypothetical protein